MKKNITLFGGSGTMGFETFKELWNRRDKLEICLLLRPSKKNKDLFAPYLKKNDAPRIVWGDATIYEDVKKAIDGTEYVLDAMAFISPMADYYPKTAKAVNINGIENILKAIGEEPDGNNRIKLAYTGTVAETGDRLPPIHWGRTGDPLKPSIFDYYAVTKIAGERSVLESEIKHWVSLRMTYIIPMTFKEYSALTDPIMFHMPINSCMENISARDAGLGLANVVDIDESSDFWGGVYNMGGGPRMRITAWDYQNKSTAMFGGKDIRNRAERKWFATQNFHMQYYADSDKLNGYLNYWRDSFEDWQKILLKTLPFGMKILIKLATRNEKLKVKIDKGAADIYRKMAIGNRNGTAWWGEKNNFKRLDSFFGGREAYENIPDWSDPLPELFLEDEPVGLLDHGYDETKDLLDEKDLKGAANFRGGTCDAKGWQGDLFKSVKWTCAFGHKFTAKPNTVLKGGHWCPQCEAPDWDFRKIAAKNPFFNQVIEPFEARLPDYPITEEDLTDIEEADKD